MIISWTRITRAFRKPKVKRPYRPSAKQVALAARAEAVGMTLRRGKGFWELTYHDFSVHYFPNLDGVEAAIYLWELGKLPAKGDTQNG
jgi:hypothetical protein